MQQGSAGLAGRQGAHPGLAEVPSAGMAEAARRKAKVPASGLVCASGPRPIAQQSTWGAGGRGGGASRRETRRRECFGCAQQGRPARLAGPN